MIERIVVEKLRHRDEEAFEIVYYEYKDLVFFIAYNILKSRSDAEEVVQDTFLKMLNEINRFDGCHFKAWLMTIARNTSLNFYRTKSRENYILDENIVNVRPAKDSFELEYRIYLELAEFLQEDEYEIVMLKIIYNMRNREIAEYLKIPIGTVGWIYMKALQKLRKKFPNGGVK